MENLDKSSIRQSFIPLTFNKYQIFNHEDKLWHKYHDHSQVLEVQYLTKFQKIFKKLDKMIPIIRRDSTRLIFWNFLVMISLIYNFFQIPIAIFYQQNVYITQFTTYAGLIINYSFLVVLLIDWLLVRPNTSIERKGFIIISREAILKQYLKFQFWLNGFCRIILLIYIVSQSYNLIYGKIIFYGQLYSLIQIHQFNLSSLGLFRIRLLLYRLIFLLAIILIIVVWVGGIFFAIDYSFYNQQNQYYNQYLWLTNSSCTGNSIDIISQYKGQWWVWLDYSTYWALQTMSTVGYGDLTPRNPPQTIYCNVVILLTLFMFAFFVNSIWQIVTDASEMRTKTSMNIRLYKKFRRDNNLPTEIEQKLFAYLSQKWQQDENDQIDKVIDKILPQQLKFQLYLNYRRKIFNGIKFLQKLKIDSDFHNFLLDLISQIKQSRYAQNQIISDIGNINCQLYYVLRGNIILSYPPSGYQNKIKVFQNFGKVQFITGMATKYRALSEGFTKLSHISFSKFKQVIKSNKQISEQYYFTKETIMYLKDTQYISEICWECQGHHMFIDCPVLFKMKMDISKDIGIMKLRSQYDQLNKLVTRRSYQRKKIVSLKHKPHSIYPQINIDLVCNRQYCDKQYNIS